MRRAITSFVALAAATTVLVACSADEDDDSPTGTETVSVGIIPIVDVAPIYLGQEQGYFEEEGIELELTFADGGAAIIPGVAAGEFDFGFSNVTSLLLGQSAGLPLEIIANGVASTGVEGEDFGAIMVMEDSPIQTAADLQGATVGINTLNNISDTTTRESIRNAGGDPNDVEFVEAPFPELPVLLGEGSVDAVQVVEPFKAILEAQGARAVAHNWVDAAAGLTVATYFSTVEMRETNPDLVERFTSAIEKSLAYANENPDEVRRIVGTYTEIPDEIREAMTLPAWPPEVNRGSIEILAQLGLEFGIFEATPDVDALLP